MSSHPFDASAASYDAEFSHTTLGRYLRGDVQAIISEYFKPYDRILELGCGTGEDALWMAQHGILVTATDASLGMLEIAQKKAQLAGYSDQIIFEEYNFETINNEQNKYWPSDQFQGIFSNFGALNCLPDRSMLAQHLAEWLQPGGFAIFVIMGPLCMWEIGWYLLHGNLRSAFRRFHSGITVTLKNNRDLRVWYPSLMKLRREFSPYFQCIRLAGIGIFIPPSYLERLVDRYPTLFSVAAHLDKLLNKFFPFYWISDHYLIVFRKKP